MEFIPQKPEIEPVSFNTCVSFIKRVHALGLENGFDGADQSIHVYDSVRSEDVDTLTVGFIPNELANDGSVDYFVIKTEKIASPEHGTFSIDTEYIVNAFTIDESYVVMSALLNISTERIDMPDAARHPQSVEMFEMLDMLYALSTDEHTQELIAELRALPHEQQLALHRFLIELFPQTDDIPLTESDVQEALDSLDTIRLS